MSPSLHLLAAALAGFAAGALGAMGLGGGGVLLLYLALTGTGQLAAQGINLTFFLPIAALSLVLHRKNGLVEFSAALPVAGGGVLGLLGGIALAGRLPGEHLSRIFGVLVALTARREARSALRLFRRDGCSRLRHSPRGHPPLHKPPPRGKNSL